MKKVLAIVALISVVALSSVAYGQGAANVTVGGEVAIQTATITGCSQSIPAITILTTPSSPACDISVTHNNAGGYELALGSGATNELRSLGGTNLYATDPEARIIALPEDPGATEDAVPEQLAAGTEGWAFVVDSITDANGAIAEDDDTIPSTGQGNGVVDGFWLLFDEGDHGLDAAADEIFMGSDGNFLDGVAASLVFTGAIDTTTPAADDYTTTAIATLTLNP